MAYGATSATLVLAAGYAPATASASVHLAELGTTAVSAYSHRRFGNVDWRTVRGIGIPGAIGAFIGAMILKFHLGRHRQAVDGRHPARARHLRPSALHARAGPATARAVIRSRSLPRPARSRRRSHRRHGRRGMGTGVDADAPGHRKDGAAQSGGLCGHERVSGRRGREHRLPHRPGSQGVKPAIVLPLLAGGIVAAPVAAWLVQLLTPRILGAAVGGLILLTNARTM